jgi:hypothetical protein
MRFRLLWVVALVGCTRSASPELADAAVVAQLPQVERGWELSAERLDAWLRWHAMQRAAEPKRGDAGDEVRRRAALERALLGDAGLSQTDVDQIEDLVSAVVAERTVERLTGAAAMDQFKKALAELSPEQRARAEAAFAQTSAKTPPQATATSVLEARLGEAPVRVILSREAEVTQAWERLLEARAEPK